MKLKDICAIIGALINIAYAYPLSILVNKFVEWYLEVNAGKVIIHSVMDLFKRRTTQLEILASLEYYVFYGYIIISACYLVAIPLKNKLMAIPMAFASLANSIFLIAFFIEYENRNPVATEQVKDGKNLLALSLVVSIATFCDVLGFLARKKDNESISTTLLI